MIEKFWIGSVTQGVLPRAVPCSAVNSTLACVCRLGGDTRCGFRPVIISTYPSSMNATGVPTDSEGHRRDGKAMVDRSRGMSMRAIFLIAGVILLGWLIWLLLHIRLRR